MRFAFSVLYWSARDARSSAETFELRQAPGATWQPRVFTQYVGIASCRRLDVKTGEAILTRKFLLRLLVEVFRKRIRVAHARADDQDLELVRARRELLGGDAFESRGAPRGVEHGAVEQ